MTEKQAMQLAAQLDAAFPGAMPEATFALYVAELARFQDVPAAQEAVTGFIRGSSWLPKIAELQDAYTRHARRYSELREAQRREEAAEVARKRGLPRASWERDPIPARTVEWLRARGIDVNGLLKHVDDAGEAGRNTA